MISKDSWEVYLFSFKEGIHTRRGKMEGGILEENKVGWKRVERSSTRKRAWRLENAGSRAGKRENEGKKRFECSTQSSYTRWKEDKYFCVFKGEKSNNEKELVAWWDLEKEHNMRFRVGWFRRYSRGSLVPNRVKISSTISSVGAAASDMRTDKSNELVKARNFIICVWMASNASRFASMQLSGTYNTSIDRRTGGGRIAINAQAKQWTYKT